MKIVSLTLVAALLGGSAAFAAQAPAAQPAAQAAAPQAGAPSDETISKFATVMLRFKELQKEGKGSDQAAMAKVITDVGISFDDYNKLTTAMRIDTALNDRIQAAYRSAVLASDNPSPGAPRQD